MHSANGKVMNESALSVVGESNIRTLEVRTPERRQDRYQDASRGSEEGRRLQSPYVGRFYSVGREIDVADELDFVSWNTADTQVRIGSVGGTYM